MFAHRAHLLPLSPRGCGLQIASRLADAVDALAAEAVAGGSLCGGADVAALGCWRFQLVVSYDNSAAASLADVVSDFTLLRDSLYNRPGIDADAVWYRAEEHGGGAGARGFASAPAPLFTWSEAGESHFAHALSTVFGGTTPVVRVARNARAFDGSAANFQWIGTMSTAADVATNWGEQYVLRCALRHPSRPWPALVLMLSLASLLAAGTSPTLSGSWRGRLTSAPRMRRLRTRWWQALCGLASTTPSCRRTGTAATRESLRAP